MNAPVSAPPCPLLVPGTALFPEREWVPHVHLAILYLDREYAEALVRARNFTTKLDEDGEYAIVLRKLPLSLVTRNGDHFLARERVIASVDTSQIVWEWLCPKEEQVAWRGVLEADSWVAIEQIAQGQAPDLPGIASQVARKQPAVAIRLMAGQLPFPDHNGEALSGQKLVEELEPEDMTSMLRVDNPQLRCQALSLVEELPRRFRRGS